MRDYPEFENPQQRPRYTGLPTFMRTPYREDMEALDIALVGIPFDGGVTNRTGARHGPREIRNQSSLMRMINQATGINPYELCSIADVGDAWVQKPFELTGALQENRGFFPDGPSVRNGSCFSRGRPLRHPPDFQGDCQRSSSGNGSF